VAEDVAQASQGQLERSSRTESVDALGIRPGAENDQRRLAADPVDVARDLSTPSGTATGRHRVADRIVDPGATEVDRDAIEVDRVRAAADPVPRLEDDVLDAGLAKGIGCGEPGSARADDDHPLGLTVEAPWDRPRAVVVADATGGECTACQRSRECDSRSHRGGGTKQLAAGRSPSPSTIEQGNLADRARESRYTTHVTPSTIGLDDRRWDLSAPLAACPSVVFRGASRYSLPMPNTQSVDYGPLATLIGSWRGDKGMDIAPDPEGIEENPYFETLVFTPIGDVTNANDQVLVGLRYHQCVSRKSTQLPFHDQVGYWLWDVRSSTIIQSLLIPRAVGVLAAGRWTAGSGPLVLEVASDDSNWGVVQSPFMRDNARTVGFRHRIVVDGATLTYEEATIVDIYGKRFEHTDTNTLTRA
jgi:hypothetical protein